jgi:hypothetical protein
MDDPFFHTWLVPPPFNYLPPFALPAPLPRAKIEILPVAVHKPELDALQRRPARAQHSSRRGRVAVGVVAVLLAACAKVVPGRVVPTAHPVASAPNATAPNAVGGSDSADAMARLQGSPLRLDADELVAREPPPSGPRSNGRAHTSTKRARPFGMGVSTRCGLGRCGLSRPAGTPACRPPLHRRCGSGGS